MKAVAISEKGSFWQIKNLKAAILAFDQVYIPQNTNPEESRNLSMDLLNTNISIQSVEYLQQQGIIQQSPIKTGPLVDQALKLITKYNNHNKGVDSNTKYIFGNILERLSVKELSVGSEDIFIPSSTLTTLPTLKSKIQSEVYSLVIENLPIIREDVPFDEIISFKNENSLDYKRLLLWAAKKSMDESEKYKKEELSEMINNFRRHQDVADLKFRPGKVELIFQGLSMARDIATLKFGSVNKTIASIRKNKAQLLEHEINNPNGPLSYVVKAQDNFK